MSLSAARYLLALCVLALIGFAAVTWSHQVPPETTKHYAASLRELQSLEFRRTADILEARSGVVNHFDSLARTEAHLRQVHAELLEVPEYLGPAAVSELQARVRRSDELRREGERLVERFKSEHAVYRNSARFLSLLAEEVSTYEPTSAEERTTKAAIDTLIREVLLVQLWNDQATMFRAKIAVDRLGSRVSTLPRLSQVDLHLLLTHARIVVNRNQTVNHVLAELKRLPLREQSEALVASYRVHEQSAALRASRDRAILFALALLTIAATAGYVILRLRRSATELKRSSADLALANDSLKQEQAKQKELAELKSRFVSMTSHEFRTPLSVVVSSSEMLSAYDEVWSKEKKESHLSRIRESALSMTRMLDDILLIGKTDSGMLRFSPVALSLEQFCDDLVAAVEQTSRTSGRIAVEGLESLPDFILDENLLRHALENLLSNALKYSPDDSGVSLKVSVDSDQLCFVVHDDGIGIPAEDLTHLFETFHRGSNVGKRPGTGLGLSIVKRAAELHGGSVAVESAPGEGSTFWLYLPKDREAA